MTTTNYTPHALRIQRKRIRDGRCRQTPFMSGGRRFGGIHSRRRVVFGGQCVFFFSK